ncbi:MAG: DUF4097 family beta strand repeat-containing protein [Acidobacteriia bacterium]|nr:DUF4097 family beta strand repeat-containing protein [Terriglobia bacterium]
MREQTIPATAGVLHVDGRTNGGISVKGWDRHEVLVRSQVRTAAPNKAEADQLASQITIQTNGAEVRSEGPTMDNDHNWSVSYEIFVPQQTNLSLKTHNGGIRIADVSGNIDFKALNGGVSLARLSGDVRGGTTNGGLSIDLAGTHWEGRGLDVQTTNGGVHMNVPHDYSAHLETGTVNGSLNIEFPVTVQGKISRQLSMDLGSGGATVRATTTNGGVKISRKS